MTECDLIAALLQLLLVYLVGRDAAKAIYANGLLKRKKP